MAETMPLVASAASLLEYLPKQRKRTPLFHVVAQDRRARALHAILTALDPSGRTALYPEWDVLPHDRLAPSPQIIGIRMGLLRWLTDAENPPDLVITTPAALLRRVPPRSIWAQAHVALQPGQRISPDALHEQLLQIGYIDSDLANQPGEMALRGQTMDVFPAAASRPCRILHDDRTIIDIRSYDPATQASDMTTQLLVIDPAAEILHDGDQAETIFDYSPACRLILEEEAPQRARAVFEQIAEGEAAGTRCTHKDAFLTQDEWAAEIARRRIAVWDALAHEPVPSFARERNAGQALLRFIAAQQAAHRSLLLTGVGEGLAALRRRVRGRADISEARGWQEIRTGGRIMSRPAPVQEGAVLPSLNLAIIAAGDFLGSRAIPLAQMARADPLLAMDMRIGDVVVHEKHGLAILRALETLDVPGEGQRDLIRLEYGDEASEMVPIEDIGLIWRYGGDPEAVTLDRLDRDTWARRKEAVAEELARTARHLVDLANQRLARHVSPIIAPPDVYERIAARFPYALTDDQALAIRAVLDNLASGRPMDRLVCGDVGYGKTEVALRAAAAVALSGFQVALLAPTTLLARQHLRLFQRRFAGLGLTIRELSRLTEAAEARDTRAALRCGQVDIVIGTHALLSKTVRFEKLGLVIIDEEQKFGARHKAQARELAEDIHLLAMTATPIPRTLSAGLVGLIDLSIIATPPLLRLPVRTSVVDFSPDMIREALRRERRRGGQSFYICPRIEGMEELEAKLRALVPELRILVAHGRMKPADMDAAMLAFAEGEGDVLLATGIVESGLDVPRANTIIVHEAGRFGMAQLHQLRGRVGRGNRRAFAFFLRQTSGRWRTAEKRLRTLASLDHLGAGFALSTRDLDLRGAGDLLGEDQAGHIKMIGTGLYQELLEHALAVARGDESAQKPLPPVFNLGLTGRLPEDYVPDPDLRLSLYRSIAGLADEGEVEQSAAALIDRFGPVPEETDVLLALKRLRLACAALGILRLDAGEAGIAATFGPHVADRIPLAEPSWKTSGDRIVQPISAERMQERLSMIETFLDTLAQSLEEAGLVRATTS